MRPLRARTCPAWVALTLLGALSAPRAARAHQASVVYGQLTVAGKEVTARVEIADLELAAALGGDPERVASRGEVRASATRLGHHLAERLRVENGGAACEPTPADAVEILDKGERFFAAVTITYACKRTAADLTVRYDLFFDLDPRHEAFFRMTLPGQPEREQVFRARDREAHLSREVGLGHHVADYLLLGVEHIFTGYDHLAFLLGLLVVMGFARPREAVRRVAGVVTAFTCAHSITLIAAALGVVRVPTEVVEPAIALSILYVAIENLARPSPRRRWRLTFGFGLVHGLGFASVLREIGLPPRGLVLSLLSFNLGVELGQLAVVLAVAPLLHLLTRGRLRAIEALGLLGLATCALALLRSFALPVPQLVVVVVGVPLAWIALVPRQGYDRVVRVGGSAALALLALLWLAERIAGRAYLGGVLG